MCRFALFISATVLYALLFTPLAPGAETEQPVLIYSSWTKFCLKGQEADAEQFCYTGTEGRMEASARPLVSAILIEPEDQRKRVLRITVLLGVRLEPGTRLIVDRKEPMASPYLVCDPNGCMADYEVSPDLFAQLKQGKTLTVQAVNSAGRPINFTLPLDQFAKAYDGPPADAKIFENQRQLRDKLFEDERYERQLRDRLRWKRTSMLENFR